MSVIGLRARFFLTILAVLLVATSGSILLHSIHLKRERITLIDEQMRETAATLLESELSELRTITFQKVDEIISEELEESRIGKFFVIRNAKGEKIFESASGKLLPVENIAQDPQWVELRANGFYIRALNLKLPSLPDRFLQVGIIMDEALLSSSYISLTSIHFLTVVLILGLAASFLLTSFLLKPIKQLESFLAHMSAGGVHQPELPMVPYSFSNRANPRSRDEFERMIAGLNALISKVNKNYKLSRLWAYQMAHELKTPLSILRLEIEKLQIRRGLDDREVEPVLSEGVRISEIINSFLGWAELENSDRNQNLFAVRLSQIVKSVADRLDSSHRINLIISKDPELIANPQHIEQLVSNLLRNALIHSAETDSITVTVDSQQLLIVDNGPGIPSEVLERMGEPFNRGHIGGHGLGLAWVKSICQLYGWAIDFKNRSPGTEVVISFPTSEI